MNCAWADYGIVPPEQLSGKSTSVLDLMPSPAGGGRIDSRQGRPSTTVPNVTSTIAPPVVHVSGVLASVSVNLLHAGGGIAFAESWSCQFYKYGGHWALSGCQSLPEVKGG